MLYIKLLETFNNNDLKEFKLFLTSPYFKYSKLTIRLFELSIKQIQRQEGEKMDKEKIFQQLFKPHDSYNSIRVNKEVFRLNRAIEDFLSIQQVQRNEPVKLQLQMQAFKERSLTKFYNKKTDKVLQIIEKQKNRDWTYHLNKFSINHSLFLHPDTAKSGTSIESLQRANEHLDLFYLMVKMRLGIEVAFRKKWSNDETDISYLEHIKPIAADQDDKTLDLYTKILSLAETEAFQEDLFKSILKNLKKSFQLLSLPEQKLVYFFLTNYTTNFINKGQNQYLPIQLKLYKIAINEKIIIENNRITDSSFTNISLTFILCRKFKEAENFILAHKQYLAPEIKKSAIAMSRVYLSFHRKEYDKAIHYINTATTLAPHYKLRTRSLYIRCIYERFIVDIPGTKKLIYSELLNYKQYFNRMQLLSSVRKTAYQSLGKAIKMMTDILIFPEGKLRNSKMERLKTFVRDHSIVAKPWVIEKMKKL